jgi:hypothetical protein
MLKECPVAVIRRREIVNDNVRPMGCEERLKIQLAVADIVRVPSDDEQSCLFESIL